MTDGLIDCFRHHPALLGWQIGWLGAEQQQPEIWRTRNEIVNERDGRHLTAVGVSGSLAARPTVYDGTAQAITVVDFPIPSRSLASVPGNIAAVCQARIPGEAVWHTVQALDMKYWSAQPAANSRPPTLDEMRLLSFGALAGGAQGLQFYSWEYLRRDPASFESRWRDMTALAGELKLLLPWLTSEQAVPDLRLEPVPANQAAARAWLADDGLLLVAVNPSDALAAGVVWRTPAGYGPPELVAGQAAKIDTQALDLGPMQAVAVKLPKLP